MPAQDESFMGWVQLLERAWGVESYEGKPTLKELLSASVVAIWYPTEPGDTRFTATIHENMNELNAYVSNLFLHSKRKLPKRRLARLFIDRRLMRVRGLRILLEDTLSTPS